MEDKKVARSDTTTTTNSSCRDLIVSTMTTNWRSVFIIVGIAFGGALQMMMISINGWPYLNNLDGEARQEFFGLAKTASTLGVMLSSFVTGWITNRISDTKPAILFGIIFYIFNALAYANIDMFSVGLRKWAYLVVEVLFGICGGSVMTWRVYIGMSTATEDRQRSFGLTNVAINSALITTPFIVIPFGKMFANSFTLPWGSNLSIFTAPVYVCALLNLLVAIVVYFFYDGRIQAKETDQQELQKSEEENRRWTRSDSVAELATNSVAQGVTTIEPLAEKSVESSSLECSTLSTEEQQIKTDWIAIGCCFLVRFCITTYYLYLFTLSSSFTMATFGWSGAEAVTYSTISQALLGTMGLLISIGFSTKFLSRFAPERFYVLFSILMALLFFLLTFQWPFITARLPNCDSAKYPWCEHTPATNVYIYNIAMVGCMGLALPIFFQNIDVLYSRLLGNMKQGTLQAAFHAVGESTSIIGPPLINFVFQNYGPVMIWGTYICLMTAGSILWFFNYRRLLPKGVPEKNEKN